MRGAALIAKPVYSYCFGLARHMPHAGYCDWVFGWLCARFLARIRHSRAEIATQASPLCRAESGDSAKPVRANVPRRTIAIQLFRVMRGRPRTVFARCPRSRSRTEELHRHPPIIEVCCNHTVVRAKQDCGRITVVTEGAAGPSQYHFNHVVNA
jgi:hypothetical protein